jgi:hypothetical protein
MQYKKKDNSNPLYMEPKSITTIKTRKEKKRKEKYLLCPCRYGTVARI